MNLAAELLAITQSLRAHLEWQAECGTTGLPRDPQAKQRIQERLRQEHDERRAQRAGHGQAGGALDLAAEGLAAERPTAYGPSAYGPSAHGAITPGPTTAGSPSASSPRKTPTQPQSALSGAGSALSDQPATADREMPATAGRDMRATAGRDMPKERVALSVARPAVGGGPHAELSMAELQTMAAGCTACALSAGRTNSVFARGTGTSGICFVGEGPGAEEDLRGEPFVGAAGQLLDKMIQAMGLGREDVYVCNVVKCRPPDNRKPQPEEMQACSGYLKRQLELLNPEVIVALGGTAVSGLLGVNEGITRLRGTFRLYNGAIPVMPTFHPAYLLRTPAAKREVWADLLKVLAHLGRAAPTRS